MSYSDPYSHENDYPVFSDLTNPEVPENTSEGANENRFSREMHEEPAESSAVNRKRKASNSERLENEVKYTLLESSQAHNALPEHGIRYQQPPMDSMYELHSYGYYFNAWNQQMQQFHQHHPSLMPHPEMAQYQMPVPPMSNPQLYPLDGYYQQPEPARTPPMADQQEYAISQQTPAEVRQPVGSIMYTPESDVSTTLDPDSTSVENRLKSTTDVNNSTQKKPEAPAQKQKKKKPTVIVDSSTLAVTEFFSHGNAATILKTFATDSPDGDIKVSDVDGRLPAVGCRSKYSVTVDEIRRRVCAPEYLNISGLYTFFRKSKQKSSNIDVKRILEDHNIACAKMQRQKVATRFSPMLEEECLHLAKDLEKLTNRYFPVVTVSHQLVCDMLSKNSLEKTVGYLENTLVMIDFIVKSLQARQPKVSGQQERLKGNRVDVTYHLFSVLTHGFGHPNSLNHYKLYRVIFDRALLLCTQLQQGKQLEPIKVLKSGEKPFALMRPEAYARWKGSVDHDENEKARMMEMYRDYQDRMPSTSSRWTQAEISITRD